MEDAPLSPLLDLPPAEAQAYLVALARQEGAAALETLRLALEMPALTTAALEALAEVPDQEAWDLLERAAREGTSSALRKQARRSQHRLRSRGFNPQPVAPEAAAVAVEQARASFFDFDGSQFLRVVRPAALGMARYASFVVSPEGLTDCAYVLAGRTDLDAALAEEGERLGMDLLEVGLAYVARRVRQAVARSREHKEALPQSYLEAERLLEDAPEDAVPEELAAVASEQPPTTNEVYSLLRHRSMARWLFLPDKMEPYVQDWLHLLQFQPVRTQEGVTNLGAVQAHGQLVARIIGDLCGEGECRRLVEQLREQVRLLLVQGEDELAGVAARSAAGLEQHAGPDDPFLRALVDESMDMAIRLAQAKEEQEKQGPWQPIEGEGGALWVPRPAGTDEEEGPEEEKPAPRLWLPGQS